MPTNIMKCSHDLVFSQDKEEFKASELMRDIVSGIYEAAAVAYANPSLLELGKVRESMIKWMVPC